jgi:hypothetical protein
MPGGVLHLSLMLTEMKHRLAVADSWFFPCFHWGKHSFPAASEELQICNLLI